LAVIAKEMRVLKRVSIGILIFLVLWTVGCSVGLPVIPIVETNYFISESSKPLADGYILKHSYREITKLEIPNYFPVNDQCLDFCFKSSMGKHLLTVNNFKMTVKNNDETEMEKLNSYLICYDGSEDKKFSISNYYIENTGDKDNYVIFRTVVDLSRESKFSINIKADYYVDSVESKIDKTFNLEKKTILTWNEFSVH
jgi:hypothetical protein